MKGNILIKGNIKNLKDRYLYRIHARNGNFGIWIKEHKAFLLSRIKFGENYLFEEYHWSAGWGGNISYGTAYELEEIEKVPFTVRHYGHNWISNDKILEYLNRKEKDYAEDIQS